MTVKERSNEESGQPHPSLNFWSLRLIWGLLLIAGILVIVFGMSRLQSQIEIINRSGESVNVVSVDLDLSPSGSKRLLRNRILAPDERLVVSYPFRSGATGFSVRYQIEELPSRSWHNSIDAKSADWGCRATFTIDSTTYRGRWKVHSQGESLFNLRRFWPW